MHILNKKQVQYCQLVRSEGGKEIGLSGLAYQNKLFVQVASYEKDRASEAVSYARAEFLTQKGLVEFLVIEEEIQYTVWSQDNRVKIKQEKKPNPDDIVFTIDLKQLVSEMRNVGGIKIRDRRYGLKVYPRCFVGSEVVEWISEKLNISKEVSIKIGQRLINEKWIHHVVDEQPFKDGYFFYRFYYDE
jgi:Domain found in Dishevelled, Egl-10, and Pleckstrin (DEP)